MNLTRRELLALSGAGLVAPALAGGRPSGPGREFVYFSDSHVSETRNVEDCRAMLAKIKTLCQADFAINGGDVTDYGWDVEYRSYGRLIQEFGVRTFHVPGNHDVRWSPLGAKIFRDRLGDPFMGLDWLGGQLFLLDSTVPLSHWGHYTRAQLRWLERGLQAAGRTEPIILATHHWVGRDNVMIDNEEELLALIEPYNVKLILTGHGHSDLLWNWDGIPCVMNRGLYQGSWMRLTSPERSNELVVERYTKEKDRLDPLTIIPLAASRAKRPVWALGGITLRPGEALGRDFAEATEARWNQSAWQPLTSARSATPTTPGTHRLTVRNAKRQASGLVSVSTQNSPLKQIWNAPLPGEVMSHLVTDGTDIFVSTFSGHLCRIEPTKGIGRWQTALEGLCHATPCLHEDKIIQATNDGYVYGIGKNNGNILWAFRANGPVPMSPIVVRDTVVFAAGDGKFYGLDATSGQNKWTVDMPASRTAFAQSRAATDGNLAFIGAWDSHLYAIDPVSGKTVWRQACMERTFAFSPAIGGPAVSKGKVIVPANGNGLFCFDCVTGDKEWEVAAQGDKYGHSSPLIHDDSIIVGCLGDKGQVRRVKLSSGKEEWVAETGSVIYDSSPTLGAGFVAIGSVANLLSLIEPKKGTILGQISLPPGHFLSSPLAIGDQVFAATFNGRLIAWTVKLT